MASPPKKPLTQEEWQMMNENNGPHVSEEQMKDYADAMKRSAGAEKPLTQEEWQMMNENNGPHVSEEQMKKYGDHMKRSAGGQAPRTDMKAALSDVSPALKAEAEYAKKHPTNKVVVQNLQAKMEARGIDTGDHNHSGQILHEGATVGEEPLDGVLGEKTGRGIDNLLGSDSTLPHARRHAGPHKRMDTQHNHTKTHDQRRVDAHQKGKPKAGANDKLRALQNSLL